MKALLTILALLFASPASAQTLGGFDYVMSFASQSAAQSDPVLQQLGYYTPPSGSNPGGWNGANVMPGVQIWNPTNDQTPPPTCGPQGNAVCPPVHTYLTGWWLVIYTTARIPQLDSHASTAFVMDRAAADNGKPPAQYIVYVNGSFFPSVIALINATRFQPHWAGSNYDALRP